MYPYYPYYYVNPAYVSAYVYSYPNVPYRTNYYYSTSQPYGYNQVRNYPEVNPDMLMKSAEKMRVLVHDATLLLNKISISKTFSIDLMAAAQQSNNKKVEEMIRSTGVKNTPSIAYTPDGLKLKFSGNVENVDCCHLGIDLRWTK
jgi:hypothetical protein